MPAAPIPSGYNPLGGIAVIASNTWAAQQGRKKLKIEWDFGPNADYDTTAYRAQLEATGKRGGRIGRSKGAVRQALAPAAQRGSADYFVPHYAHAPMEVPNAVAALSEMPARPGHPPRTRRAPARSSPRCWARRRR